MKRHDYAEIHDSLTQLRLANADELNDRYRIRSILDGGPAGIYAVLAWDVGKRASMETAIADITEEFGVDLPTVNMMDSGLTRLGQKVGRVPTLKPPKADGQVHIDRNQKRVDMLRDWDRVGKMSKQFPQAGRWLPGYGVLFNRWAQRRDQQGKLISHMELRDPFSTFVGWLGPDQKPREYATVRRIPLKALMQRIDDSEEAALVGRALKNKAVAGDDWSFLSEGPRGWEGVQSGVELIEYEDITGSYVVIPEAEYVLSFMPNPVGIPLFNFSRRVTFNRPQSQYQQIIGVMAMQAKLNILYLMALEDGVMVETNIEGDLESGEYEFGRDATNYLTPGTNVTKPYPPNQSQTLQGINMLERQLRIGAQYDVQQDGQSPNSFATGMGMRELQGAVNDNVREYHVVMRDHYEECDAIRLQVAEALYAGEKRTYFDMRGKRQTATVDQVIDGDYRTRRIYGAMATFDDHQKIIVGMQLETGGYIDPLTFQENIDGLEDLELINERIAAKRARESLYAMLQQESMENPVAKEAFAQILKDPGKEDKILFDYFGPQAVEEAEEMAMQQQAMMAQQQSAMSGGPVGVPDPIQSVLSRVEGSGAVDGGVQSVVVQ